jgi:hypothetical protein
MERALARSAAAAHTPQAAPSRHARATRALRPAAAPRRRAAPALGMPRATPGDGDAAAQGDAAPPAAPLSWWQKLAADLDLGPAGFEDGSARDLMGAMDFAEATSPEEDAALAAAREFVGGPDGQRMTPEQSAALKKKIGGSYRGFFKEWVEVRNSASAAQAQRVSCRSRIRTLLICRCCVSRADALCGAADAVRAAQPKGDAVDEGIVFYDKETGVDQATSSVAYAPLLAATLLGVGAVLAVVISRT